ncbi:hypothetical protein [Vibrio europaeus]|uniref:hypothetical protein n=1 Tax=Vibrio europaeus TaxID=300876 RepID=UPI0039E0794F
MSERTILSPRLSAQGDASHTYNSSEKTTLADHRATSRRVLGDFIFSKQSMGILPRSVQQLESGIRSFIEFSQVHVYDATPKLAMQFREKLHRDGKAEKSDILLALIKELS